MRLRKRLRQRLEKSRTNFLILCILLLDSLFSRSLYYLFTVLCYKRSSISEGTSSPATVSVGNTTPPRVGEPKVDDEGQPSPTTSSSIPSTRNRDNDARYRKGTSLVDDVLKGHACADMLKQKAMNAELAFPERYVIVPQPAIPVRTQGLVRIARLCAAKECTHPSRTISKQGSNHHCQRRRCVACGTLLAGKSWTNPPQQPQQPPTVN